MPDTDETERLRERIEQLEREIKRLKDTSGTDRQKDIEKQADTPYTRRNFLKLLTGGAAGVGVASMLPSAAAFRINSGQGFSYFNRSSSSPSFDVSPSGVVEASQIGSASNPVTLHVDEIIDAAGVSHTGELADKTDLGSGGNSTTGIDQEFTYVINGRKLWSTEQQEYWVDPDDGDDTNDGSQSSPFQTIERASRELALFQFHGFRINLAKANPSTVYDAPNLPPVILGYDEQEVGNEGYACFHLVGDRDNPTAYPFETGRKLGIAFNQNHDSPNAMIEGVHLGGVNLDGLCRFVKCHFDGWDGDGTCVTGYTGRATMRGCTYTSNATYAFGLGWNKILSDRYGTFNCDYLCHPGGDGGVLFLAGDPGIPAFESESAYNDSNVIIQANGNAQIFGSMTPY